jgi:AcrR family transcriptional regulator
MQLFVATEPRGTPQRILEAALETLREDGFHGSSARTIARRGGFNQALIFYHYGSLTDLLLAALDHTSRQRLQRYREALAPARDLPAAVAVAADLYAEDMRSGHLKVLAELISGASSVPGLGSAIVERMQPWTDFTEETLERLIGGTPLTQVMTVPQMAHTVVALYLGIEMLTHLDGDTTRAEELFRTARRSSRLTNRILRALSAVQRVRRRPR